MMQIYGLRGNLFFSNKFVSQSYQHNWSEPIWSRRGADSQYGDGGEKTISLFIGDITTLSCPTNIASSAQLPSSVKLYLCFIKISSSWPGWHVRAGSDGMIRPSSSPISYHMRWIWPKLMKLLTGRWSSEPWQPLSQNVSPHSLTRPDTHTAGL